MAETILTAVIGIACIIIGLRNRKGNVSMLHSYHRNRVSEEDRIPFGKLVGLGTIAIGVALLSMSTLNFLAEQLQNPLLGQIGNILMIVGFVAGIGIAFYAMIKYNKGIF